MTAGGRVLAALFLLASGGLAGAATAPGTVSRLPSAAPGPPRPQRYWLNLLSSKKLGLGLERVKAASWPEKRVSFVAGERQSPINIDSKFVIPKDLNPFKFFNHDIDCAFVTQNNGHTAKIMKNDTNCRPMIVGGPLRDAFFLDNIHFHWDSEGSKGSEHSIDGHKYSVEAHAVYFNSKYKTFNNALQNPDGLAVVGFFIEEGIRPTPEIEGMLGALIGLKEAGSKGKMNAAEALGWAEEVAQEREYYTYPGSLTTPPYSENVVFIIFPFPLPASKKAISILRSMRSAQGPIHPNWRDVQPLFERLIVHSYNQA